MGKHWTIVEGGKPVTKRKRARADKPDKPMTRVEVRKALENELERQLAELSPAERGELVAALSKRSGNGLREQVRSVAVSKGRSDELEPGDLGGGVAAIEVETAYGERRRLPGKEAGDPAGHVAKEGGVSYAKALAAQPIRQQNGRVRRPRGDGAVRRLLDD